MSKNPLKSRITIYFENSTSNLVNRVYGICNGDLKSMKIEIGLSNGENITFNEFYSNPYVILTPKNPNNALIWSCSVVNITPSSATISCYYLGNNGEWIKYNDGIQYIAIGYMK